jgi:hypothetical protein
MKIAICSEHAEPKGEATQVKEQWYEICSEAYYLMVEVGPPSGYSHDLSLLPMLRSASVLSNAVSLDQRKLFDIAMGLLVHSH